MIRLLLGKVFSVCYSVKHFVDSRFRTPLKNHKNIGFLSNTSLASHVMPNGDPRDGFFYPTLTLIMDYYIPSLGPVGTGYMK